MPRPSLARAADKIARTSGLETVVGRPSVVLSNKRLQREMPTVEQTVDALAGRIDPTALAPSDEPLFVFSAGWRSGSTLLQRLIISAGTYFLWGEPYSRANLVQSLAESLRPLASGWPPEDHLYDAEKLSNSPEALSQAWIANMFPPLETLLAAHRSLLSTWLAPPTDQSHLGWGMKEVRVSAAYAAYLRLLYPHAKIIFLVRDPVAAYASYRSRPFWYERWPSSQVRTPRAFGRVWCRLAGSFMTHHEELGALLIRYEDLLADPATADRLEQLLGAPIDRTVLTTRVDGTDVAHQGKLTPVQRRVIARYTAPVATELGYVVAE